MNKLLRMTSQATGTVLLGLTLGQCTLGEQVSETPSAVPMQFRLVQIDEATLGSIDVKALRAPEDLNLATRSQLIRDYVSGPLPLKMRLTLEGRSNGEQPGTLTGYDYEVLLDGKPLGGGRAVANQAVPATATTFALPLAFELNTHQLLGNDALPALRNFAVGLADRRRRPLRLGLRLRPSVLLPDGHTVRAATFAVLATDSTAQPAAN